MWPLVMYSNCIEWNLSKEQMVINLYAMLLLEACLLLYHYTISNDYIVQGIKTHGRVSAAKKAV